MKRNKLVKAIVEIATDYSFDGCNEAGATIAAETLIQELVAKKIINVN